MNNISQHSFCPLGFIVGHFYNDSMLLVSSSSSNCSVLSPFRGSSFAFFRLGRIRSWNDLTSVVYSSTDSYPLYSFVDFKKNTFLFSVSSSILLFVVMHIGF